MRTCKNENGKKCNKMEQGSMFPRSRASFESKSILFQTNLLDEDSAISTSSTRGTQISTSQPSWLFST